MGLGGLDVGDDQLGDDEEEKEDEELPERSLPEPGEEGRRVADSQEVRSSRMVTSTRASRVHVDV